MAWLACEQCRRSFHTADVQEPNRCPRCGAYHMALCQDTISAFIKNNYPAMTRIDKGDRLSLRCSLCGKEIEVRSMKELGMSLNAYTMGLLRQVIDNHNLRECGQAIVVKTAALTKIPEGRKITLED